MGIKINVLILEDNGSDAELMKRELRKGGLNFTAEFAQNKNTFLNVIDKFSPDIILADYSLPDFDGLSALRIARERFPEIPVIIVSGAIGEETAIEALKSGATDYVLKDRIKRLVPVVNRALNEAEVTRERKRAEKVLVEERTNLQKIFDIVNVGMLLVDEHGTVKRVNNVVANWGGKDRAVICDKVQPGDILGCTHALNDYAGCGHTPHCHSCPIRKTFEAVLRSKKPIHGVETEVDLLIEKDHVRLWLDVSADPFNIDEKNYVILSVSNITERKLAEQVLKRDKKSLEKIVQERTEELLAAKEAMDRSRRLSDIGILAATVAHELRNPLAAILMASNNIKRKAQDPNLEKHLANIEKKVGESDQIINNLLFYSRLKSPQYENIKIFDVIEECVENLKQPDKKEVGVVKNINFIRDILIEADPIQTREVFSNILNNAYDAVPVKKGQINVTAENEDEFVKVAIKDNGSGIAKDILDKIFEPFFTTKAKGTGLGLSVCKQIINMHEGEIGVKSEPGQGTSIVVRLPKKERKKERKKE